MPPLLLELLYWLAFIVLTHIRSAGFKQEYYVIACLSLTVQVYEVPKGVNATSEVTVDLCTNHIIVRLGNFMVTCFWVGKTWRWSVDMTSVAARVVVFACNLLLLPVMACESLYTYDFETLHTTSCIVI